jgi:tRNA(His) guanylyltransferase
MSSIPVNAEPRKLSFQHLRSPSNLKTNDGEEKGNLGNATQGTLTPSRTSPPLNTNKELPNPPVGERRVVSDPNKRKESNGWQNDDHLAMHELPAIPVRHSRQQSQPVSSPNEWGSYAQLYDKLQSSVPGSRGAIEADSQPVPSSKETSRSKRHAHAKSEAKSEAHRSKDVSKFESTKKNRIPATHASSAGKETSRGRPTQMSRTQKDKDRKKRSKARIITEHVDLIKDDFWEKRPWILSGKTG